MNPVKIGFVLLSNSGNPLPSTRIAVLNMLPFLRDARFDCHVVYEPAQSAERPDIPDIAQRLADEGFRIVFFQKVRGPAVLQLVQRLSALGVKAVFGVCDVVDPEMVAATDATIAVTEFLRELHPPELRGKISVVHDGIENSQARKSRWSQSRGSRKDPLRAVLVASSSPSRLPVLESPPPWLHVTIVGAYPASGKATDYLRQARWKMLEQTWMERRAYISFLANRRIRCVPWDPQGVYAELLKADIGIIPVDAPPQTGPNLPVPPWKAKSENRLTLKMSTGLPVVSTPIPSYEAVVRHGVNGFLAPTRRDWMDSLEALRDPQLRRDIGERARVSVVERYSQHEQARRLIDVLRRVLQEPPAGEEPLLARGAASSGRAA